MKIKIKKYQIRLALKLMGKKNLAEMAKLSEKDFIKKVKSNPKAIEFPDDVIKVMYKQVVKKAGKNV